MEPIRTTLIAAWLVVAGRCRRAMSDDRGMSTETAIITGLFAVLAVAVAGIITARAMGWANSTPQAGG